MQEMRDKVVEAEVEVPLTMADALREGKIGVVDYYNLQNIVSDTQMRGSLAKMGDQGSGEGGPVKPAGQ